MGNRSVTKKSLSFHSLVGWGLTDPDHPPNHRLFCWSRVRVRVQYHLQTFAFIRVKIRSSSLCSYAKLPLGNPVSPTGTVSACIGICSRSKESTPSPAEDCIIGDLDGGIQESKMWFLPYLRNRHRHLQRIVSSVISMVGYKKVRCGFYLTYSSKLSPRCNTLQAPSSIHSFLCTSFGS